MRLAYVRSQKPKATATPEKDWMELKYAKRLADNQAEFLKANGISKEDWIKRILSNQK